MIRRKLSARGSYTSNSFLQWFFFTPQGQIPVKTLPLLKWCTYIPLHFSKGNNLFTQHHFRLSLAFAFCFALLMYACESVYIQISVPVKSFMGLQLDFMCLFVLLYQIKWTTPLFETLLCCIWRLPNKYSSTGNSQGAVLEFLDLFEQECKHHGGLCTLHLFC